MKPFMKEERPAQTASKDAGTVKEAVARTAQAAGAHLAHLGQEAARVKTAVATAVSETVEDGKVAARRALKRSRVRAEDFVDETSLRIRRAPLQSVAIAFGVGALLGALITPLLRRKS